MRIMRVLAIGAVVSVVGVGVAVASHVTQVDPATVPIGFLAAHNSIEEVPVAKIRRAVKEGDGVDLFIQHARLSAGQSTVWHTHPGPVFVTVVDGSLIYQDAHRGTCQQVTYDEGTGFVDPGFGHVHRAIGAEPSGVDFYAVYVLPHGSENHLIPADAPGDCPS